jgi:protein-arginine deiminase
VDRRAVALTPDLANCLVLVKGKTDKIIINKTTGPLKPGETDDEFKKLVKQAATAHGLTIEFVDAWCYHERIGDIHCGTNVRRKPSGTFWWRR